MNAAKERPGGDVTLTLAYEEAVVLSEMLARWERDGTEDRLPFEDQAEQRVLWDLNASLEPVIDELVGGSYDAIVAHSRLVVRDSHSR